MRKLVFLFVAFAAVSFASCGGNKTSNTEAANNANIEDTVSACNSTKACCDSAKTCCDSAKVCSDSVACDSAKACCNAK